MHDSSPSARGRRGVWLLALIVLCAPSAAFPGKGKDQPRGKGQIQPGPLAISAEEQAIVADPAAGIEHAVILLEETDRNEDLSSGSQTAYHLRAKILSNEGRDLANIELPVIASDDRLLQWWAYTILPDGRVLELKQSQLEQQSVARTRGVEVQELKAALPGVEPGCVIDYGYVLKEIGSYRPYDRIPLQRSWMIKRFRYDWTPYQWLQGAFRVARAEGLNVQTRVEGQSVIVRGRDLPPVLEEPRMPPDHEVQAALMLYYLPIGTDFDSYWDDIASFIEALLKDGISKKKTLNQALAEMNLPQEAPLEQKLRAAYEWIGANIARTDLQSFEQLELGGDDDAKRKRDLIANLLAQREGTGFELQELFIAVARRLGAEANLVLLSDRTRNFWDEALKSMHQFDASVVAVKLTGRDELLFAAPGSGLEFGEVPWWVSGQQGLMMTKDRGRKVVLPSSQPARNVSECIVELRFEDDNELVVTEWTETGSGQVGLDERRYLRRLEPDDREERIHRLCGLGPDNEVLTAEVAALDDLTRDLELHCETESYDSDLDDNIDHYNMAFGGPWLPTLPDLEAGDRTHPIIFDFPRIDVLRMKVQSPAGFVAGEPPAGAKFESPYGKYRLIVEHNDDGFRIERALALYHVAIPAAEYDDLRDFFDQVRRHDRKTLAFRRQ